MSISQDSLTKNLSTCKPSLSIKRGLSSLKIHNSKNNETDMSGKAKGDKLTQVVILAGGLATRLLPITETIPKSMVLLKGKPFFEYQIRLCRENGIDEIVFCGGHLWEQVEEYFGDGKDYGINIVYSIENEKLDTGGALKYALPYLEKEFFVMYGDSYLTVNWQEVFRFYKNSGARGLMTVYENNWSPEPSNVLVNKGGHIVEYNKEKPRREMRHIEYGINIFPKDLVGQVTEKVFPISRYFDLLINSKQLISYTSNNRFYEVGCFEGIEGCLKVL